LSNLYAGALLKEKEEKRAQKSIKILI